MPLADFSINSEYRGQQREVRIVVYDSVRALRAAAQRYANEDRRRSRRKRGEFADTLGLCHRFEWIDDRGESRPECAIVRLAEPHLGVGVVSHELAHAAVHIRELADADAPLSVEDDEDFCWLLGDLVRQTVLGMDEHGVFDR